MSPIVPTFHSREHLEWITRRLTRNITFRQRCDAWARLPVAEHRIAAAAMLARAA